jgi:hypothetical protein
MSNWRPDEQPGSKSTMSGGFESTDTPDFLPEEVDPNSPDFKEGMYGSQKQNAQKDRNMDPGVAGALEVNPDVYVPEAEEITVDTSQFVLPKSGMTDLDLDMCVGAQHRTSAPYGLYWRSPAACVSNAGLRPTPRQRPSTLMCARSR